MERIGLGRLVGFCKGQAGENLNNIEATGVSTDSRGIKPGELFVCLKGERFNGHHYIEAAARAGAVAAVINEDEDVATDLIPLIRVSDTGQALLDIAKGYRKLFDVKVTAITGSVGKTTTKEMTAAVLSSRFCTLKNEGNLNNQIGLPLSVMRLARKHQAAVFEMGMNHFGEISSMSKAACPDVAVITNIGVAHIENLGSREGILKAKLEILDGLSPKGTVVLNGDDPYLFGLRNTLDYNVIFAGINNKECDILCTDIEPIETGVNFNAIYKSKAYKLYIPVHGVHNVRNALLAAAVGIFYGLAFEDIASGLSAFENVGRRQKIFDYNGITIIDDCYNANPDSMAAAIDVLRSLNSSGRRIAVLGDMLELGSDAQRLHFETGKKVAVGADMLIAYGEGTEAIVAGAREAGMPESKAILMNSHGDVAMKLAAEVKKGDVILFKGSRGMRMEEALRIFMEEV